MNKVLETNGTKISKDESYDEFCDRLKIKSMFHGYSLFLTELHNKKYISLDYINKIMDIVVERLQGVDKINNEISNTENEVDLEDFPLGVARAHLHENYILAQTKDSLV